jgi:hypothetical protein
MGFKSAKLLIATIGLSLGTAASAEKLVYVTTDVSDTILYYDVETIRKYSNNTVEVWIKKDESKNKTVPYRTSRGKVRIDCSAETYGTIAIYKYRADGTVMDSGFTEYPNKNPIPPESAINELFKILCPK